MKLPLLLSEDTYLTTVLVDGDIVVYRACAAVEKEIRWDEWNHVLQSNFLEAWDVVQSIMDGIARDTGSSTYAVAFSGGDNFRKQLSPSYKAHRKGRKPLAYLRVREAMEAKWRCKSFEGLEGDDLLGIWQTCGKLGDTIIWTADKDMKGIPGKLWDHKLGKVVEISEDEANRFWMTQVLTGDTSDGYKGLPGCGPKSAEKILGPWQGLPALWEAVKGAYQEAGLGEEDALLQARLARILRAEDWDSQNKEIKLWKPE